MPEFFKGDATELKYYNSVADTLDTLSASKDDFLEGAYSCFLLGELLWDTGRAPLSVGIPRDIFKESFAELFESFQVAGTFESYLSVFRKVFGDDVEVEFTVPAAGKLNIDIAAVGVETSNFTARTVVDNDWVIDNVIHDDIEADALDDNILFQSVHGFQSQYDLEQMLFEMVPSGIYTEITLTLGG